ncbi:MAG: citramalate synthase [Chloroflexi bacterium]|nr:citramalate synthase [Chloroflexota bacterium]
MVQLYDTTLRDGAQREGISFSVEDKLKIVRKLDSLGVHFIEGGWPGANPKDTEFFARAKELKLHHSRMAAFGSTRRPNTSAESDANLRALVKAGFPVATIVGKTWDFQVTQVLGAILEENLAMIRESTLFLKAHGLTVFFDAEHFFDGFKANPEYAVKCLQAAAGAECIILCDTNGGTLPDDVSGAIQAVRKLVPTPLGIHAHNDGELAVANSLAAVQAGASQVQGTINGYGERCGNANLCSIIPSLQLKLGIPCLAPEQLARLTEVSRFVSETANLTPDSHLPYVGSSAFAHKAGYHVAAMMKSEKSYQHIDPALVGNAKRVLVSDLSGKSMIRYKAKEHGIAPALNGEDAQSILDKMKALENKGFQYDGAEASFELLIHRNANGYRPPFELVDFMVVIENLRRAPTSGDGGMLAEAMVKVKVGNEIVHTAAEGNGPVNALDSALRQALLRFYPPLKQVKLVDYKVRILEEAAGTSAQVRVLIESSDGKGEWRTVGSSTNIIEASWQALVDSLEYWLWKRNV